MSRLITIVMAAVVCGAGCASHRGVSIGGPAIGVYDSRAVAVAYAGSPRHEAALTETQTAYEEAKAGGDAEAVAAYEKAMREGQERMHRQGFSGAPVDDILAQYPEEVAALKERRGLEALVSKWDEEGLAKHEGADRVDVTGELIEVPHPTEKQRKSAEKIQRHPLVPADKLPKH